MSIRAVLRAALRGRRERVEVDIAEDPRLASREGVIERIAERRGAVEVTLLLDDGTDAAVRMDRHRADWLELRPGDIVPVHAAAGGAVSG